MPATAEKRISRIGFSLRTDPAKQMPKSSQLHPSMKLAPSSVLGKISSRAAAAIMPMTTGFMPVIAPSIYRFPLSFRKKRVSSSMTVSEGRQTAKVAITEPRIPHQHPVPAWQPTV